MSGPWFFWIRYCVAIATLRRVSVFIVFILPETFLDYNAIIKHASIHAQLYLLVCNISCTNFCKQTLSILLNAKDGCFDWRMSATNASMIKSKATYSPLDSVFPSNTLFQYEAAWVKSWSRVWRWSITETLVDGFMHRLLRSCFEKRKRTRWLSVVQIRKRLALAMLRLENYPCLQFSILEYRMQHRFWPEDKVGWVWNY